MKSALALAACALSACAQMLAPDVGPPAHAVCTNTDSDPDHDVSFAQTIAPMFDEYHCRNCHTPTGSTPLGLEVGGLDLSDYDSLRAGGVRSGANIVVPGRPCDSVLLQKLGPAPPFGSRMPMDGPPYVDSQDLVHISDWIVEGANDN